MRRTPGLVTGSSLTLADAPDRNNMGRRERNYVEPLEVGDLVGLATRVDDEPQPIKKIRTMDGELRFLVGKRWWTRSHIFYCPTIEQIEERKRRFDVV